MCLMGGGGNEGGRGENSRQTDTVRSGSRGVGGLTCKILGMLYKPCGNRLGEHVETEWTEKGREEFKRIRCRRKFSLKGGKKLSPVRVLLRQELPGRGVPSRQCGMVLRAKGTRGIAVVVCRAMSRGTKPSLGRWDEKLGGGGQERSDANEVFSSKPCPLPDPIPIP